MNSAQTKSGPRPGTVGPNNGKKWPNWPNTGSAACTRAGPALRRGDWHRGVDRVAVRSSRWVPPRSGGGIGQGRGEKSTHRWQLNGEVAEDTTRGGLSATTALR
jgi:hypothetical protein